MQCISWFIEGAAALQDAVGPSRLVLAVLALLVVFARVFLRLPYAAILAALCAPALLFVADHPYAKLLEGVDPRMIFAAGWLVVLAAAAALRLLYAASAWLNPFGPRFTPLVALTGAACLALLAIVSLSPESLDALRPGWRQTWGMACLGAAGLALLVSCARCLRFAVPLLFWGAVLASLAGYAAYRKSPAELLRLEQRDLARLYPQVEAAKAGVVSGIKTAVRVRLNH